jgi:hypothetical protein
MDDKKLRLYVIEYGTIYPNICIICTVHEVNVLSEPWKWMVAESGEVTEEAAYTAGK